MLVHTCAQPQASQRLCTHPESFIHQIINKYHRHLYKRQPDTLLSRLLLRASVGHVTAAAAKLVTQKPGCVLKWYGRWQECVWHLAVV